MHPAFRAFENTLAETVADTFGSFVANSRWSGACSPPEPVSEACIVATIGFAAEHARGNVAIVAPCSTVAAICAELGMDPSNAAMCDVFGELGNMLLGRIKNRLLARGVTLMIGLPSAQTATDVRLLYGACSSSWHAVAVAGSECRVRLSVCFDDDFGFDDEQPAESRAQGAEGAMLFF